jgi:inosine-uridine nucleoside N-ribohydrolase
MKKLLSSLGLLLVCLLLSSGGSYGQAKKRIILDADTGNEVDDLYAISRALIEPTWEVIALNATQWQPSHRAVPESMENSFRINEALVGYLGVNVPLKRGGPNRMYDWGDLAQHSAAAYEIIKQARLLPAGQRLTVVALGALTNVASALYIDPTLADRLEVYWLGSSYDFERGILSLTEFNCVMDIQALHLMLRSTVPMHIIPVTTARSLVFSYAETEAKLRGVHPLANLLVDRWYQQMGGGRLSRILWDLALVEAMIHPEWAEQMEVTTSKDNGNRPIWFYKSIQADRMKADFFDTLLPYLKAKK